MPCGSKMRSRRSISCTWYCMVSRSSKYSAACSPMGRRRCFLCSMTRVRKISRVRAYCSSPYKSSAVSFFMIGSLFRSVGATQQRQGMNRGAAVGKSVFDVVGRHGAVAAVVVDLSLAHPIDDRLDDFHGRDVEFLLHRVGAVVSRAALYGFNLGIGDQ